MTSEEMLFYAKFTELVRLCLDEERMEHSSWNPYRREIVETLLKRHFSPFVMLSRPRWLM